MNFFSHSSCIDSSIYPYFLSFSSFSYCVISFTTFSSLLFILFYNQFIYSLFYMLSPCPAITLFFSYPLFCYFSLFTSFVLHQCIFLLLFLFHVLLSVYLFFFLAPSFTLCSSIILFSSLTLSSIFFHSLFCYQCICCFFSSLSLPCSVVSVPIFFSLEPSFMLCSAIILSIFLSFSLFYLLSLRFSINVSVVFFHLSLPSLYIYCLRLYSFLMLSLSFFITYTVTTKP